MSLLSSFLLLAASALQFPSDYEDAGLTDLQNRQLGYDFGRCVVDSRAKRAARVIVENLSNSEIIRNHSILFDGDCLVEAWPHNGQGGMQMKLPGDLMRYSLADALVEREFAAGLPSEISTRPPLAHDTVNLAEFEPKPGKKLKKAQLEELATRKASAVRFNYLARFGECIVRTNPSGSHRLIMQKPGSRDERAAFVALQPAFNNCLDTGQTFSANFTVLRGTVALNAYRLARATPSAGASR